MTLLLEPHSQEKQERRQRVRERPGNAGERGTDQAEEKQGNRRAALRNICKERNEAGLQEPKGLNKNMGGPTFIPVFSWNSVCIFVHFPSEEQFPPTPCAASPLQNTPHGPGLLRFQWQPALVLGGVGWGLLCLLSDGWT